MTYTVNLTPVAVEDIQTAMDYYNSRSPNLGYRFTDEVENSLQAIVKLPEAYGYRYKNVRAKLFLPLAVFPFANCDTGQRRNTNLVWCDAAPIFVGRNQYLIASAIKTTVRNSKKSAITLTVQKSVHRQRAFPSCGSEPDQAVQRDA